MSVYSDTWDWNSENSGWTTGPLNLQTPEPRPQWVQCHGGTFDGLQMMWDQDTRTLHMRFPEGRLVDMTGITFEVNEDGTLSVTGPDHL